MERLGSQLLQSNTSQARLVADPASQTMGGADGGDHQEDIEFGAAASRAAVDKPGSRLGVECNGAVLVDTTRS